MTLWVYDSGIHTASNNCNVFYINEDVVKSHKVSLYKKLC